MTAIVYATKNANRVVPAVQPNGSEAVTVRFEFDLTAALLITDVVKLGWLPANCKVTDWMVDSDDLSDSAAGTFGLGILASTGLTVDTTASGGAAWVAGSTLMQAGGVVRPIIAAHTRMVVSRTADQLIGIVMAASCTTTATGKFGLTLTYIAA